MAYEVPYPLIEDLQRYFRDSVSEKALFQAIINGLSVDGMLMKLPTYRVVGDTYRVQRTLGIQWPLLNQLGVDISSLPAMLRKFRPYIERASQDGSIEPKQIDPVVSAI